MSEGFGVIGGADIYLHRLDVDDRPRLIRTNLSLADLQRRPQPGYIDPGRYGRSLDAGKNPDGQRVYFLTDEAMHRWLRRLAEATTVDTVRPHTRTRR